jgi:hypothetical protein
MLFGRGNWAVFGIEPTTMENFQKALSDPLTIFEVSQLAASITTKFQDKPTTGITPYGSPRLDEKLTDTAVITDVSDLLTKLDDGGDVDAGELDLITQNLAYVGSEDDFSLGNSTYAFWFVSNEYEDPTDPNSKKEELSYADMERPFKFLIKEEKKSIEERVTATAILNRSQFPVLVDFQHGRVYAASSNVDAVIAVQELLTSLGAKTFPLVWDFEYPTWPSDFLNRISKDTNFKAEMKTRAEELSRLRPDEIEKLEDRAMEKVVANYFAITELDNEIWVALSTPARIRLHKPIDPVGVSNPSVAFELLNMSNDAEVATAAVVFQELVIKQTKTGEKMYRNDLFTIDINDKANLQDAGAAMLRGFDLPQFKKEIKTTIKAKGKIAIKDFWYMWLDGIHTSILTFTDNLTNVLEIDKAKYGLVQPEFGGTNDVGDGECVYR